MTTLKRAKEIIENAYKRPDHLFTLDESKEISGYCQIGCNKCELKEFYGKCPIIITLPTCGHTYPRGDDNV
jgi:hypothetical protein